MPRVAKGLVAKQVEKMKTPGLYADGNGLYLQVKDSGAKSWIFRYSAPGGKRREMGLGPVSLLSLAEAREKALELRKGVVMQGLDPIEAKKAKAAIAVLNGMTFERCALDYIAGMSGQWSNSKSEAQWTTSLTSYAFPVIGDSSVADIDTSAVLRVIEPIWNEKTETASRIRGRIESILDYAKVRGYRSGDNPARWKGNLEHILPARAAVAPVEHHTSLDYSEIPEFWLSLQKQLGMGARALALCILTATRSGEVIGARWDEIDLDKAIWVIPAARMKARQEHQVPLSPAAVSLLRDLPRTGDFCFPGQKQGEHISNMTMTAVLKRMDVEATAHGFRSSFRTWAAEKTDFPHEVCEAALAHTVADKVVAAYQRGTFFEKRRALMQKWASYIANEHNTELF